ncbi:MAG: thiopeptide-type bacteriocin biosynthesis protein [Candidatus Aminicenantes bacterium]|nr:thiopeptide-type bacteriocin biosynthesis protein [Candidatus Aminicenantes bacterium]
METKNSTKKEIKRTFILGDEWLYYKFYLGPKTADAVLAEMIKPAAVEFLSSGFIDKWFFIRYGDPQPHIRLRFHLVKPPFIFNVIQAMQALSTPYIEQDLIWKVQVDSYRREVERYGVETMAMSESLFFHDSVMIVDMLDMITGDEGEKFRWLFGVRAVDALLDDFHFPMERKLGLLTFLKESFGREFDINKSLRDQLKTKYRTEKEAMTIVLDRSQDEASEFMPLFDLLAKKSQTTAPIVSDILKLDGKGRLHSGLNDLLASYIHMLLNRLFRTKQRLHELVIYDFLYNYYKSEIAKKKYGKKK